MAKELNLRREEPKAILTVNKWKFILWLFIITILMLFASQTSAYLVRRAEGNWVEFELPQIFWYSTVVLVISSILIQIAYFSAKKDNFSTLKLTITGSFIAGIAFLIMQYIGWQQLQQDGIFLKGNPSGSFMYVLTGLHAFHLVTGLVVIAFAFVAAFRMKIHAKSLLQLEICTTYWHFLDALWIYLFVFLLYFR